MSTPDPFSVNVLKNVLSPKIVRGETGGYDVKLDMINVDTIYVTGDVIGPTGSYWNHSGGATSGSTGYTGYTGRTGDTGYTGRTGDTGYTGYDGRTGDTGYTGYTGRTGDTGYTGSSGTTGATGYTGYTGPSAATNVFPTTNIIGSDNYLGNSVFVSSAGGLWNQYSTTFRIVRNITWNGSMWVAVGRGLTDKASIQYSTNGTVWNEIPGAGGFSSALGGCGVASNGISWVTVGHINISTSDPIPSTIQISQNPTGSWNAATTGGFSTLGRGVAYSPTNGGLWVAVGSHTFSNGSIQWSTDGHNWNLILSGSGFQRDINGAYMFTRGGNSIATNGSRWVAVGSGETTAQSIQWSDDGKNWNLCTNGGFVQTGSNLGGSCVATNGSIWVAGGYDTSSTKTIQWSDDGKYWNPTTGGFNNLCNGITWDGTKWLAVGTDATILSSLDGKTWTPLTPFSFSAYCIATNNMWATSPGTDTVTVINKLISTLFYTKGTYI